jgi:putative transposase
MTDTIDDVAAKAAGQEPVEPAIDEQSVAEQLVTQAREKGIELVGPSGLLSQLTKRVLETALEARMSDHLSYDKHDPAGRNRGTSRNGVRSKTVLTEIGPVQLEVPRDVDASFTPTIVKKQQRRLTGVDQMVLSLAARGLTSGEISAHFAEVYGASVSRETVSKITDQVLEEMTGWMNRPLDEGRWKPPGVSGHLHRRHRGQGARRPGAQQALLCRHRGHRERGTRHLGTVARRRRRGERSFGCRSSPS